MPLVVEGVCNRCQRLGCCRRADEDLCGYATGTPVRMARRSIVRRAAGLVSAAAAAASSSRRSREPARCPRTSSCSPPSPPFRGETGWPVVRFDGPAHAWSDDEDVLDAVLSTVAGCLIRERGRDCCNRESQSADGDRYVYLLVCLLPSLAYVDRFGVPAGCPRTGRVEGGGVHRGRKRQSRGPPSTTSRRSSGSSGGPGVAGSRRLAIGARAQAAAQAATPRQCDTERGDPVPVRIDVETGHAVTV
jgi:hypothetical protein